MNTERTILITAAGLKALRKSSLTKVENIVFWYLIESIPLAGNLISHVDLGEKVSVNNVRIGRIMKRFCEIGFLIRGVKMGLNYHYKLNPAFFRIL
ncbi:MAG: hypothetical protein M0Z48_10325 [Nitrospiraceae bacterium]|nr:hypothetical protein [Nitrospiraceae bacterium]